MDGRRLRSTAASVVIAGLLCARLVTATARADTVTFVGAERPVEFTAVIAAFEKANPQTHIEYTQVPFDALNAEIQARIGSQDPSIDLYCADTPRIPAFAKRGYLLDLSSDRDNIEKAAGQTALASVSSNGKPWAFPMWTSTQLLFANLTLLRKAGEQPPSAMPDQRLTWDELLTRARHAQQAGSRWGFTFEQVDRYYQLQFLFASAGAGTGLTGDGNTTPDVASPAWIRMARWYGALFADGLSPRGVTPEQTPDLFANGQVAYFVGGPWNFPKFDQAKDLSYGVAPVPYVAGGKPATPTDSWAIGINPYAAHKDMAIKFARFLTLDPEGNWLTVENNPLIPTNKVAYGRYLDAMAKMDGAVGPAARNIISYELTHTTVQRPRSVAYVTFEDIMNRAFSDIRNGADPQATMTQAQARLASALARSR